MKKESDFTALYEALDFRIDADDVQTVNQLRTLLERYGFYTGGKEGDTPQQVAKKNEKITAESWRYLKGRAIGTEKREGMITTRTTPRRKDRVLNYTIEYKGKTYPQGSKPPENIPKSPYKFVLQKTRNIPVKQATVTITYKGKKYRKGQFLPKDLKVS